MQSAQQVVHAKIGHQYAGKGQDAVGMKTHIAFEQWEGRAMQGQGVDQECSERPSFLGVPSPIPTPRHIGPNGTDEDAYCQQKYGWGEPHFAKGVKRTAPYFMPHALTT